MIDTAENEIQTLKPCRCGLTCGCEECQPRSFSVKLHKTEKIEKTIYPWGNDYDDCEYCKHKNGGKCPLKK